MKHLKTAASNSPIFTQSTQTLEARVMNRMSFLLHLLCFQTRRRKHMFIRFVLPSKQFLSGIRGSVYPGPSSSFPLAEVSGLSGCYFHMKTCLWKKVRELGLGRELTSRNQTSHPHVCSTGVFEAGRR